MVAGLGLAPGIVSTANATPKPTFKGCGATKDKAREELAKVVSSDIRTSYEELQSQFGEEEKQQILSEVNVKSQLELFGAEPKQAGDNEYCVTQTLDDLQTSFDAALKIVLNTCDPEKVRDSGLDECRSEGTTAKTLYPLFHQRVKNSDLKRLYAWTRSIEEKAAKQLHQAVTFNVEAANTYALKDAVVVINHLPRVLGQEIPLKPGKVEYVIQVPKHCAITGEITLSKGSSRDKVVKRVSNDLADYKYPEIIFKTEAVNAQLFVEGTRATPSQTMTVERCSGPLPYYLQAGAQRVNGVVDLKPGLNKIETITVSDRPFLDRVAKAWETRQGVLFRYGGGVPLAGGIDPDWIQTVQVEYLSVYDPIRIGGGVLYGFGGSRDHQFEAYGKIIAQLTRIGDLPLHIGSRLAFVPFIGIEAGLGYHGHRPRDTGKRGDFGSAAESVIVFRGVAGTSLALNEVFSLIAEANWAFVTHERRLGVNLGLGFLF